MFVMVVLIMFVVVVFKWNFYWLNKFNSKLNKYSVYLIIDRSLVSLRIWKKATIEFDRKAFVYYIINKCLVCIKWSKIVFFFFQFRKLVYIF